MARIIWDGYDTYADVAQLDTTHQQRGSTSFVTGRFGGQAMRCGLNSGAGINRATPSTITEGVIGVAFRLSTTPGDEVSGIRFTSGAATGLTNTQVGLAFTAGGAIRVFRGATAVELWRSAEGIVDPGAWHYLNFGAIIDPAVGEIKVALDGEDLVALTGLNTRGQATPAINSIRFSGLTNNNQLDYDDFYLDDDYSTDMVERRVEVARVTADGATLNLTPSTGTSHFAMVDETLASVTDYLSGSTVGQLDELVLGNLATTPAAIDGVKIVGYGLKTDAATRAWNFGIRQGASDALGPDLYLNATLSQLSNYQLVDPATGVAWTAAGVNSALLIPRVAI